MAKHNLLKKTKYKKVLVCILYHNNEINLFKLIKKISLKKQHRILIVVDGKIIINNRKKFYSPLHKGVAFFHWNLKVK